MLMTDSKDESRNPVEGHVELASGYTLFWWTDPAVGCRVYESDEIGGGVFVWNTALVDQTTLLAAILQELALQKIELRELRRKQLEQEQSAKKDEPPP